MEITIKRVTLTEDFTEGVMELEPGVKFCDTIEDAVRAEKVMHKTAIPAGRYKLIMSYSNRWKRVMHQLVNVPNFEGIRIHPGNTADDSSGCILIGKKDFNGHIRDSKTTYDILIYELTVDKSDHYITIK
jgi:hypothetical protein